MLRNETEIKTLESLEMSARTKSYFLNRFSSIDEIIFFGRNKAYILSCNPEKTEEKAENKSTLELISALDKAGYIRHDITYMSFMVSRLYRCIFSEIDETEAPADVRDLCIERVSKIGGNETYHIANYKKGNERYDRFENPTEEHLDNIRRVMKDLITGREYDVIAFILGLEDGIPHTFEQAADQFGVNIYRIQQIRARGFRKMRRARVAIPAVLPSVRELQNVDQIIEELEELRKDPIFKREEELICRLRDISAKPFIGAAKARAYLEEEDSDHTSIDYLGFSVRTYNCLNRAGINTVSEIVQLPNNEWDKVRNLGTKNKREIEDVIRKRGYQDFSILS